MDIVDAFHQVGTYRGAADMCGTTHKTVKRLIERLLAGELDTTKTGASRARNTDCVKDLVAQRVGDTKARITAKRLLPEAKAAGYEGSARNFRRAVSKAKREWRTTQARVRRPGVWHPGQHLVIDWGADKGLHVFCAVLAWSRYRFIRFATDERQETTLRLLAECFEDLGGVPAVVLADRMGCLKGQVVANVVVPAPGYVRFATHYGFRPDFCEAADPESKGVVEHLVGYAKRDLMVGLPDGIGVHEANELAENWCAEVNAARHAEIAAVPNARLESERATLRPLPGLRLRIGTPVMRKVDKLACIRLGSARYSVPARLVGRTVEVSCRDAQVLIIDRDEIVAEHALVAPGEVSIVDEHYGGPRPAPRRAPRPKSHTEKAFLELGEVAESFLKGAAAQGVNKLATELADIVSLERAWGRDALIAALSRATAFSRFRANDVRSILAAGKGVPCPTPEGDALVLDLPSLESRPLSTYVTEELA
jgi:transposase